jgi:hypothetical protein
VRASGPGANVERELQSSNIAIGEIFVKIKTFLLGVMLAVGFGTGMNAQAWGMWECCNAQRDTCLLNSAPEPCEAEFQACMSSNRCIVQ